MPVEPVVEHDHDENGNHDENGDHDGNGGRDKNGDRDKNRDKDWVFVPRTHGVDLERAIGAQTIEDQARLVLQRVEAALAGVGAKAGDVVEARCLVPATQVDPWAVERCLAILRARLPPIRVQSVAAGLFPAGVLVEVDAHARRRGG